MSADRDSMHLRIFGSGDAPPLLLLHPIATQGDIWSLQIPVLARDRQVIVPDLPGHGQSAMLAHGASIGDYAHAVLRAIKPMGLTRITVAGLSFGGMVAQAIALAEPARIQRMVLAHCGATTSAAVAEVWQQRLRMAGQAGMADQVAPTLERWFTSDFRQQAPSTCRWVGDMIAQTPMEGYAGAVQAICGLDHASSLPRLRIPTLVIGCDRDKAVPLEVSESMARSVGQSKFVVLSNAAHLGNIEQSTQFTETLCAFLA